LGLIAKNKNTTIYAAEAGATPLLLTSCLINIKKNTIHLDGVLFGQVNRTQSSLLISLPA
jgi:hypothetical protein